MSPVLFAVPVYPPSNIFFFRFRFTLPTAKQPIHRSIYASRLIDLSLFEKKKKKKNTRYRVTSRTRCTQTVNSVRNIYDFDELLASRRRKESMHAYISRVHFCSDSTVVSPLRHASLSPCASRVTDKKLGFSRDR